MGCRMEKLNNHWDRSLSEIVPYMQWFENDKGITDYWTVCKHNHIKQEIHLILGGECLLSVGNEEVPLKKGQGILIAPNIYHGPQWTAGTFSRFNIVFSLNESFLAELWKEGQPPFFVFEMDEQLFRLHELILLEYQQLESLFHKIAITDLYSTLLIHVLRIIQKSVSIEKHEPKTKSLDDTTIIDTFFGTTPLKQQTKKELAKRLHCSERQLLRKIYTYYGISFREMQTLSRIERAKHLLKSTKKEIWEISEAIGYSNAAFHKMFQRHTGTTPAKYRKAVQSSDVTPSEKKHQ